MQRLRSFALFYVLCFQPVSAVVSFEAFTEQYGRRYDGGMREYQERRALFEKRAAKVLEQNNRPNRRWTAGINTFSDRTLTELKNLRGWRRRGSKEELARHKHGHEKREDSLSLRQTTRGKSRAPLADKVSWAFLNATKRHYNQGSCGSCWAIASTVLLEAHSEIHAYPDGKGRSFSAQELVSCVPNPHHCGGTGGCEGATIELAMDWAIKHGLAEDSEVPYKAIDGECMARKSSEGSSLLQIMDRSVTRSSLPEEDDASWLDTSPAGAAFGMMSWERLPENKYDDLLIALQDGPVGISVAASDWFEYSHGVFDRCEKDAVIDHAVVLIGYAKDSSGDGYWLIKNSWGPEWGEHGQMRLLRRGETDDEDEGSWCGVDSQPELGSGCDGGPSEVTVCGTCGILYDTVRPHWKGSSEKARQKAQSDEKY